MSELTEQIRATCDSIADNQKKVYDFGFEQGKNLGGYSEGFEAGKKSQDEEFWEGFTDGGKRTSFSNAFAYWGNEYIRPTRKIIPMINTGANQTFARCQKLRKVEADYFDFSQKPRGTQSTQGFYYTFFIGWHLEEIEDVGIKADFGYYNTFSDCSELHTIAKLGSDENTIFSGAFVNCLQLKNITIEGVIGQDGFNVQWSTKLSKASWISIMTAASTTASITITGSLISVNKAFETSLGANDGSTSPEWLALKAARPTVSVSLI